MSWFSLRETVPAAAALILIASTSTAEVCFTFAPELDQRLRRVYEDDSSVSIDRRAEELFLWVEYLGAVIDVGAVKGELCIPPELNRTQIGARFYKTWANYSDDLNPNQCAADRVFKMLWIEYACTTIRPERDGTIE